MESPYPTILKEKSIIMLKENYFWPYMGKNVQDVIKRYAIYQKAKSQTLPRGFCTPLPVPSFP